MNDMELELRVRDRRERILAESENDHLVGRAPPGQGLRVRLADALFALVVKLDPARSRWVTTRSRAV